MNKLLRSILTLLSVLVFVTGAQAQTLTISIDATDLPNKLLTSKLQIPVDRVSVKDGKLAVWYPKWVPGSHGPGGPIQNVAGMKFFDQDGNLLTWQRAGGEVCKIYVHVPDGATSLKAHIRYIANQPATGSMGHDAYGSPLLGFVSAGTVLVYPEGWSIDEAQVDGSLLLPQGWVTATALEAGESTDENAVAFKKTTMRKFVDSPIMCGRHHKSYELSEEKSIPSHKLHIFSEAESVLDLPKPMVAKMQSMVTQAARLFGSHPFEDFDILLATSDVLKRNGLEHSSSSFNILGQRSFQEPNKLKGWDRLLVPHEYIHAWCGKYRRPKGMATTDFHTPKSTELLWVYEGLTQYLGELVEARSGLMSADEFRHRFAIEIRRALTQQGRDWRTLADTGACSHILRAGSTYWPRLRRSQAYYMEGMLFWLEADAIIRNESNGEKSLDDFCQAFFKYEPGDRHPNPFTRDEIVSTLNTVTNFDWDGLIRRRIETPVDRFDPAVVDLLGYSLQYSNKKPDIPSTTFRVTSGLDVLDSLGGVISNDGTIKDVLLDGALHRAKLGPGTKIIAVNNHKFSENRMLDAINMSTVKGKIEVMVVSGDSFEKHEIKYDGGPRYMTLERNEQKPDVLAEILKRK